MYNLYRHPNKNVSACILAGWCRWDRNGTASSDWKSLNRFKEKLEEEGLANADWELERAYEVLLRALTPPTHLFHHLAFFSERENKMLSLASAIFFTLPYKAVNHCSIPCGGNT